MIGRCTCEHKSQDEIYGRGMRLFNPRLNNKPPRCTVCHANLSGWTPGKKEEKKDAKK